MTSEHRPQQAIARRPVEQNAGREDHAPIEAESLETTTFEHDMPPPPYSGRIGTIHHEKDGFGTRATVANDGRVNISIDQRNRRSSQLLSLTVHQLNSFAETDNEPPPPPYPSQDDSSLPPSMNVVIQIVGSRGDVQPFVALAKVLKNQYSHRVRLATHPNFKDFVENNGIEFFNIGGDPQGLMAFMVKNPGLMPGFDSLRAGDVGKRRKEITEYMDGCWRSCFEAGDGLSSPPEKANLPFVADCIIANPPSFAHIHIAEKLGIPLHIFFTMPYSPTQAFPHPLANIQASNADENLTNYLSYGLVDMLTWQGLGDLMNRFRKSLGLDTISSMRAPGMLERLKIAHTYAWSPALIPKPRDWGANISIAGFFFLDQAEGYEPPADLKAFLDKGPPPVYIGFGSIVLEDPDKMTKLIFDAVRKTGQRALVSKGWGGVGADQLGDGVPDGVFMLGNVPHDWLFQKVSCVVHHGGAGTTSVGITAGRPTLVVPFFGDQPFWGSMIARAGAGPDPIPNKKLTADNLAEGILHCLQPHVKERAQEPASKMATEKGSETGAQGFHHFLDVDQLRCSVAPSRAAVWRWKKTRLSAMAAYTLAEEGLLDFKDLKAFRPREYQIDEGPWEPLSGGISAVLGTFGAMMLGVADVPTDTIKMLKARPQGKAAKAATEKKHTDAGVSSGSAISRSEPRKSAESDSRHFSSSSQAYSRSVETQSFSELAIDPSSRTSSIFSSQASLAAHSNSRLSLESDSSDQRGTTPIANAPSKELARPDSRAEGQAEGLRGDSGSDAKKNWKAAARTGKGMGRFVGAGLKAPMDFSVNMAKGFHNAPKLYGDDTVRKPDKVTGWRSGMTSAGKEFGLGMYDGITGLVTQPIKGAKEGGMGVLKGFGKGIGGFVLKPGAAMFAIPGYTMSGVYKEIQKHMGSSASMRNSIAAARIAQGLDEYQRASLGERRDVVERWKAVQRDVAKDVKKKAGPDESVGGHTSNERTRKNDGKHRSKGKKSRSEDPEATMLEMGSDWRTRDDTITQPLYDPGHLDGTTRAEFERQQAEWPGKKTQQERTEEQVVLEYIMKQSLREDQHRRRMIDGYDEEEEELRRALELSMQGHGQPGGSA